MLATLDLAQLVRLDDLALIKVLIFHFWSSSVHGIDILCACIDSEKLGYLRFNSSGFRCQFINCFKKCSIVDPLSIFAATSITLSAVSVSIKIVIAHDTIPKILHNLTEDLEKLDNVADRIH